MNIDRQTISKTWLGFDVGSPAVASYALTFAISGIMGSLVTSGIALLFIGSTPAAFMLGSGILFTLVRWRRLR